MYPYKCTLRNEIFYNNYFQINKINSVKISFEMCKNILSQSKYYRRCAISIKHTHNELRFVEYYIWSSILQGNLILKSVTCMT